MAEYIQNGDDTVSAEVFKPENYPDYEILCKNNDGVTYVKADGSMIFTKFLDKPPVYHSEPVKNNDNAVTERTIRGERECTADLAHEAEVQRVRQRLEEQERSSRVRTICIAIVVGLFVVVILAMLISSCSHDPEEIVYEYDNEYTDETCDVETAVGNNDTATEEALEINGVQHSEIERNDTYLTATPIEIGIEYYGYLSGEYYSEQDWYTFTLQSDSAICLIFYSEDQKKDRTFWDISVRSYEAPTEDIWQQFVNGRTVETTSGELRLVAGTYYVEIESSNEYSSDQYSIKIIKSENSGTED